MQRRYPHEALVFDTETLPGPAQNLRFLVWRFYRDHPDATPGMTCVEEGIAFPDDLDWLKPREFTLLRDFVARHQAETSSGFPPQLQLQPLSWWLNERFFRYGYGHRDRCAVVGFNLLFDLGRLAQYWAPAKGRYSGGYSLGFWGKFDESGKWRDSKHRGRLRLRAIDPRRTLFQWASRGKADPDPYRGPGRFVDLRTLTFALTDRPHTLETACRAFGDPYTKREVDYAELNEELVGYALDDVRHTATLYRNCLTELRRHEGIELEPHRLYSPATVGTRYLEAMGLRRPLVKFTDLSGEQLGWDDPAEIQRGGRPSIPVDEPRGDLDPRLLGWSMSAFYGGRAEARIVRTPVPVTLVDFTSMYPSVNALLGTWQLLRAERLETRDATRKVRKLLADPGLLERCLTREFWQSLGVTLVELVSAGDVLPTRARYDPASNDFGIGVNPLSYHGRLWYALPDIIAAAILNPTEDTARSLRAIKRAVQLIPVGTQLCLSPVRLRGAETIDPTGDDPFIRMIEQRQRVLNDRSLDNHERDRLERFLKITANATAYGVLARFDRREHGTPVELTIYGPDDDPSITASQTPDDPGPFCFPPIAASITAGARLMLALLERLVTDHSGNYAFCDTDSMAIVASPRGATIPCPSADGSRIRALPWMTVRQILARFDDLNPYDPTLVPSPWKVEADSLTQPLYCYAISAKRYCLYRPSRGADPGIVAALDDEDDPDGETGTAAEQVLEDWSEHGLGLYLDPTAEDADRPRRDKDGRRIWVAEAWRWVLADAQGKKPPLPVWAATYALTRFTVSSPTIEAWFSGYNTAHPDGPIRPGTFGLIAHPLTIGTRTGPLPAAPYETDVACWPALDWYDRRNGQPVRVTAVDFPDPEARAHALAGGAVPISTLAEVLSRYRRRAERKSLAPDGHPTRGTTRGLLLRRPVVSSPYDTELIGKESNRLEERQTGEVTDPDDYLNTYGRRGSTWPLVLEILRELGAPEVARRTGISRSAAYAVLRGAQPHGDHARTYEALAVAYAVRRLDTWGTDAPAGAAPTLARYLAERDARGENIKRCAWDGQPIPTGRRADARFCSDRCRRAAARLRGPAP
jgi:hypothetical protein